MTAFCSCVNAGYEKFAVRPFCGRLRRLFQAPHCAETSNPCQKQQSRVAAAQQKPPANTKAGLPYTGRVW
jgi:hypothetical protein